MTEAEIEEEVKRFSAELDKGVFKLNRPDSVADGYTEAHEERDSAAFAAFLETGLFKEISELG